MTDPYADPWAQQALPTVTADEPPVTVIYPTTPETLPVGLPSGTKAPASTATAQPKRPSPLIPLAAGGLVGLLILWLMRR